MTNLTREQGRREAFRRVQVGAAGLAGVLLLVSLTEFVIENIRKEASLTLPELVVPGEAAANAVPPPVQSSEPLADLGVTPAAEAGGQVPAVPDLEPDPKLQKRMDRDPRQPAP